MGMPKGLFSSMVPSCTALAGDEGAEGLCKRPQRYPESSSAGHLAPLPHPCILKAELFTLTPLFMWLQGFPRADAHFILQQQPQASDLGSTTLNEPKMPYRAPVTHCE